MTRQEAGGMTRARAQRLARQVLQTGYFRHRATVDRDASVRQRCPGCHEQVFAYPFAWDRERTQVRKLREALVEHLYEDCDDAERTA